MNTGAHSSLFDSDSATAIAAVTATITIDHDRTHHRNCHRNCHRTRTCTVCCASCNRSTGAYFPATKYPATSRRSDTLSTPAA